MCVSGHDNGPVFEEQPSSLIYPEGLIEGKVTLSCQARASPAASYRLVMCSHNTQAPLITTCPSLSPRSDKLTKMCKPHGTYLVLDFGFCIKKSKHWTIIYSVRSM